MRGWLIGLNLALAGVFVVLLIVLPSTDGNRTEAVPSAAAPAEAAPEETPQERTADFARICVASGIAIFNASVINQNATVRRLAVTSGTRH